jgi:hypothetical protein
MFQATSVLSFKTFKLQNVPTTKHPNNKASQIQTIPATNVPSYIVPGKKHPRYKMSQASKRPKLQNVTTKKLPMLEILKKT